ncbi:MAG TPA: YheU family protein [Pseudomonadales bacterium]|nr:YheU family protein [Pseudomonadales bacterium]
MFIPWQKLPDDTLVNMVESYCTQLHGLCADDDFDSLDSRCAQVMQALKEGKLVIHWSEAQESAWIIDPVTVVNALPA